MRSTAIMSNLEEVGLLALLGRRDVVVELRVDGVVRDPLGLRAQRLKCPRDARKVIIVPVYLHACAHSFVRVVLQHLLSI